MNNQKKNGAKLLVEDNFYINIKCKKLLQLFYKIINQKT